VSDFSKYLDPKGDYSRYHDEPVAPPVDEAKPAVARSPVARPSTTQPQDAPAGWLDKTWDKVKNAAKEAAPALGYGAARGVTMGAVDRLVGLGSDLGESVASLVHPELSAPAADTADKARTEYLANEDQASKGHGLAKMVGEGIGGAIPAIASGGVSKLAPVASAAPTIAETVAPILAKPATKLAGQGFASGVMNSQSDDPRAQLNAGLGGALVSAVASTAAEKFIDPLISKATDREARGLVENIVRNEETGASATPTAKKLLVPKLAAAVQELRQDPVLATAARTDAARAERIVSAKISNISQDRPQFYVDLDSAQPPITVAQLRNTVHQAAKTADNPSEQAALMSFRDEIESHWIPKWKDQGLLIPQEGKSLGVSSIGVRDWVSQAQEGAANTIGQINESLAKQRQNTLKRVASEMWQDHLDQAAEKVPDVVKSVRGYDARYSALASMRKIFQQRAEKEAAGTTGLVPMIAKAGEGIGTGAAAAYAFEHPEAALTGYAAMQAAKLAPRTARALNDQVLVPLAEALQRGGGKMAWPEFAQLALEKGLPQGVAKALYDRVQGRGAK
jgi:hypothetical protein